MTERDQRIFSIIDKHYPEEISFLPVISPFRFLVTVMLSASTTDRQAEKAAENLFSVYPDENAIAAADADDIEKLIRSAGLSKSKSKNIKGTAEAVAASGLPDTMEGLMSLPGVGEKTASCYMHSILGRPAVIADTHFVRVAKRLGFTDTDDRNKSAKEIRERFPESMWSRLSMALNLHGRVVCHAKPDCRSCPVSAICPSSEV